jgi:hypothetical protein
MEKISTMTGTRRLLQIRHRLRFLVSLLVVAIAVHKAASFQIYGSISIVAPSASVTSKAFISPTQCSSFLADRVSIYEPRICISSKRSVLTMGAKGDGKKKRKKKLDSPSPSPQPTSSQPATPRVSTNINIPIRRQIQYGKLNKQSRESAGTSFRQEKLVRTKYRRSWDEEEIELKAEERRRKGQVRSFFLNFSWSKFHLAFHILTVVVSSCRIQTGTSF